ncbi:hypothetical protein F2Q70_00011370 [Brassica cretica]|uniref:Uncharacterized protein n=1 Tax=Brassica cretica TaxID=69181 RepID=A0A8S9M3H5_BRACR|nr:hypothetical protein F2Q70_00011370 [Brassica cretica]
MAHRPFLLPPVPQCDEPEACSVIAIRPWSFPSGVILRVRALSSSPGSLYAACDVVGASIIYQSRRFGLAASRPCLAFQVLFFAATWLMPLISKPPDMTCITRSCRGGEMGTALVGFSVIYLLRWLLVFSERNSLRCPFLTKSLTSIFSATQSSVL